MKCEFLHNGKVAIHVILAIFAPSTYIHGNGEIYNDYNPITQVFGIKFGEFKTFTLQ